MIEIKGELWDYWDHDHMVCVTTNGTIKKDGRAVMGRGCALEASRKIPGLPAVLGQRLRLNGNHVMILTDRPLPVLVSFPVKHNWYEKADLELIKRSVEELMALWHQGWERKEIILPRPGCGNGQLIWNEVRPILVDLPDTVKVISK